MKTTAKDHFQVGVIGLCVNTREAIKIMKDTGIVIHMGG